MRESDQSDVVELSGAGPHAGDAAWVKRLGLGDSLGQVAHGDVRTRIVKEALGAASSLWLIEFLEMRHEPAIAAVLAPRLVEILAALPPRARLECCERLRLPIAVRGFQRHAGPVLRALIEDPVLRPFFADGAARLWIELDLREEALPAALGIVDEVSSMTIMSLAQMVEPEEAFEFLYARFEREPFFAELIARSPLLKGQDAWVAPALGRLHDDPKNAARMLAGAIGATAAADAAFVALWDEAHALPTDYVVDAIVAVLSQPSADEDALARGWSFGRRCREHADAIRARLRDDDGALAIFDEILRANPAAPRFGWGTGTLG